MLDIAYGAQFKKDFKACMKRGLDPARLAEVIELLANRTPLPEKFRDHPLTNSRDYKGMRECHIQPDWLLVYQIQEQRLVLALIRTGSHSDLFR